MLNITRGDEKPVTIYFVTKDACKDCGIPKDLTGAAVTVQFPNADGTILAKSGTLASAAAGKVTCTLTELETAALKIGLDQSFQATIVISSVTTIVPFYSQLNVYQQPLG